MQSPLQITFRGMEPSDAVEANIREKAEELEKFTEHITSCQVIVEAPHKHHLKGLRYSVKVDITLPGKKIVASRHPDEHRAHEDVYVAIRDAFNAAGRQLEEHVSRRHAKVKTHELPPHGIISKLYPNKDYGTIETPDGREIYFHRNSVLNADFDKLENGASVHFTEEMGEEGPQASSVHIEGRHHVT